MVTVSSKITQREYDVISYYANCCGETISNLIRKIVICDATLKYGFDGLPDYSYSIQIPHDCSADNEEQILKNVWSKSREILGYDGIDSD